MPDMTTKPDRRTPRHAMLLASAALLAGCATATDLIASKAPEEPIYKRELFQRDSPYWRAYAADGARICEGARQALMSQGYVISGQSALGLSARKFFRPEPGAGIELAVQVTCVDRASDPGRGVAYVTAWQDHLVTRKNANAASLGVNAVGSISLPLTSAEDALVKVGVDMVADPAFYRRLFDLVDSMLPAAAAATAATSGR